MKVRPEESSDSFHNSGQTDDIAEPRLWAEAWKRGIAYARGYTGGADFAEDAVQEALFRAWRRRASLRDPEMFFPWLLTIVRNELARTAAKPRPEPVARLPEQAVDEGWVQATELRLDLERSLQHLSKTERTVMRLRYEQDLTQRGIAEQLDIPEGTIKVVLHRARRKLREELSEL